MKALPLFLIVFFALYGAMHVYFWRRLRAAFPAVAAARIPVALLLAFLTFSPVAVRLAERSGHEPVALALSWLGYLWMGGVFLFCTAAMVVDLARFELVLSRRFFGGPAWRISPRLAFLLPLAVAIGANAWGYGEALKIRTEPVDIRTAKLPAGVERLRIVQISDVHIGMIVREGRLQRIVEAVQAAHPDIIVCTGDLLDSQLDDTARSVEILRGMEARYGKFAVLGNHEFFGGAEAAERFIREAGFTVLRGEVVSVRNLVRIAGVDDPAGRRNGEFRGGSERELLAEGRGNLYTILLKHLPQVDEESLGRFDLQLSGHTHKGQVFPFGVITYLAFPKHSGRYVLPKGSRLYVSRGVGTWGPPVRLLAPPEITVINLLPPRK